MSLICKCGGPINEGRSRLGYRTCLECGEQDARKRKHTVAPLHKSNYVLITDQSLLTGINVKGQR